MRMRKLRQPKQMGKPLPEVPQFGGPDTRALIFASSPFAGLLTLLRLCALNIYFLT